MTEFVVVRFKSFKKILKTRTYWTGSRWTPNLEEATVYTYLNALKVLRLMNQFTGVVSVEKKGQV